MPWAIDMNTPWLRSHAPVSRPSTDFTWSA